jgi:hypothetical protein
MTGSPAQSLACIDCSATASTASDLILYAAAARA